MKTNKNLVRNKDGSYILKHKTKKAKKGDCVKCGQNEKSRPGGLMYRYIADDMISVQDYIERQLMEYNSTKSIKPIWCGDCKAFIEYIVELDNEKSN